MTNRALNILILRQVRDDRREDFEEAVRNWIPQAIQFPGHLGVFMLTPPPGSDEYGALLRFHDEDSWKHFSSWEPYCNFLASIRPMLAAEPRTETLHGLEAWFRPRMVPPPPRWKMACITYLGVLAMVWLASRTVNLAMPDAPGWAAYLLINAIVVVGLTWAVMPGLSRVFGEWLRSRRVEA